MTPLTPSFLARNMVAAISTFRLQQALLRIVAIAGPVTTQQLIGYCRYRLPSVGVVTLRRRLTQLRKARALRTYRLHAHASVWVLPGQPRPEKRKERRMVLQPSRQRDESPKESWWVQNSREDFSRALEERWHGES